MPEQTNHVELGDYVKDPVTGFEGTVTCRSIFLHGCQRCQVTGPTLDKDGKEQILSFDEAQLAIIEAGKHAPIPTNTIRPVGGPAHDVFDRPNGATSR